jgi:hypothetical protein
MSIAVILLLIALICFIAAAASIPQPPRLSYVGLGLAFWVLSQLLGGIKL